MPIDFSKVDFYSDTGIFGDTFLELEVLFLEATRKSNYMFLIKSKKTEEFPMNWVMHAEKLYGQDVHAAVDCTSQYRTRVHPGQARYYRGDKKAFFYTALVLDSLGDQIF
eukprot:TRINITY_DN3421_c0_g2_i3.p1 TRINITY_DN3421_c0_g2~~TRINITY_DN3421_c0_g2_i3.p1  ORF type:complete len:110 (-),score=14.41 TRINITY_DN3421_c0_g2_i3:37-366(-)